MQPRNRDAYTSHDPVPDGAGETRPMTRGEEYAARALEMRRLALASDDPLAKQDYERLAHGWAAMARRNGCIVDDTSVG